MVVIKCQGTEVYPFLAQASFVLGLLDTPIRSGKGVFIPRSFQIAKC
jgi:hypothetical protein